MGGGSKSQTVGYRYYAGVHMVLCHGPIDRMNRVTVDDKLLWSAGSTGGAITVDKPELFGGDTREGGIKGTFDFLPGGRTQARNSYLFSRLGSLVSGFRGVASIVLNQMYLGMNPYLKTWSFQVQRIHIQQDGDAQWNDGDSQIDVTVYDSAGSPTTAAAMNPAHIIRECLTNKLWGMGYGTSDIDDTSFLAVAATLKAEKMGICLLWDTQKSIEDFLKIICQHIDAVIYVDRRTGKFVLKLIRNDYTPSGLLVLDPSNIDKVDDFKRSVFGELNNSITVNYWNLPDNLPASLTVQDIALLLEQGGENGTTVTYEGFVDADTASRVAQRDLIALSTPLATCTIYANKTARNLKVGDVFKLTWPDYQLTELVMRVTGMAYGNGKTRRVRISCVQDAFGYPTTAYIATPPSAWVNPSSPPGNPLYQMAFELPYFSLVQDSGQAAVDSALASNPFIGYVGAASSSSVVSAINGILYTDEGAGYTQASILDFSPSGTLTSAINLTGTTLNISGGVGLDQVALNSWLQVDNELMAVTAISGSVVTVKRGVLDTVPRTHAAGATVMFWSAFQATDPTEYVNSDVVNAKITTVNGSGASPLAGATAMTVNIAGRAARPFPPGRVRFNGADYPTADLSAPIVVTWAERNRLLQTGGTLVGFVDGPLTPEAGATVTIRLFDKFGVLFHTTTGITSSTFTITDPLIGSLDDKMFVELFSVRAGLNSFQRQYIEIQLISLISGAPLNIIMNDTATPPAGGSVNFVL